MGRKRRLWLDWRERVFYLVHTNRPAQIWYKGFQVLPKRWIVEHTFARLGKDRQLNRNYEFTTASSEAFICLAMIHLMLRRLSR